MRFKLLSAKACGLSNKIKKALIDSIQLYEQANIRNAFSDPTVVSNYINDETAKHLNVLLKEKTHAANLSTWQKIEDLPSPEFDMFKNYIKALSKAGLVYEAQRNIFLFTEDKFKALNDDAASGKPKIKTNDDVFMEILEKVKLLGTLEDIKRSAKHPAIYVKIADAIENAVEDGASIKDAIEIKFKLPASRAPMFAMGKAKKEIIAATTSANEANLEKQVEKVKVKLSEGGINFAEIELPTYEIYDAAQRKALACPWQSHSTLCPFQTFLMN